MSRTTSRIRAVKKTHARGLRKYCKRVTAHWETRRKNLQAAGENRNTQRMQQVSPKPSK